MGNAYYFCILNYFSIRGDYSMGRLFSSAGVVIFLFLASIPCGGAPKVAVVGDARKDFGKYPAKERRDASYTIKNEGDATLRIINVRKTCGCAEAKCTKEKLEPGETAEVKGVILEESIFNAYSKNIYVETNDPDQRFLSLTIAGHAVPVVKSVKPNDKIYAGRLPAGKTWRSTVEIEPEDKDLVLGEPVAECAYPIKVSVTREGAVFKVVMEIDAGERAGDLKALVKIPVVRPEGWKPVAITVSGKVGAELAVIPAKLVPAGIDGTSRNRLAFQLRLLAPDGGVIDPAKMKISDAGGATFELGKVEGNTLAAEVLLPKELAEKIKEGKSVSAVFSYPGAADATLTIGR